MPGFVIHLAVASEYVKKNKNEIKDVESFYKGVIAPDLTDKKCETHYGKSPAYTNLYKYLSENEVDTDYKKGYFMHLLTDYLFYNKYVTSIPKGGIYNDYDIINKPLIDKYNVDVIEEARFCVFYKEGLTKVLSFELACTVIDEVSNYKIEDTIDDVKNNEDKWNVYNFMK